MLRSATKRARPKECSQQRATCCAAFSRCFRWWASPEGGMSLWYVPGLSLSTQVLCDGERLPVCLLGSTQPAQVILPPGFQAWPATSRQPCCGPYGQTVIGVAA